MSFVVLADQQDPYELLGIDTDASPEEVRQSYRRLVRQFHPDVSLDKMAAHYHFIQLVDAYKTLSDPALRLQYDTTRPRRRRTRDGEDGREWKTGYSWEEELRRETLDSLITAAELYFIRGQVSQAIARCQEVLKKDPKNPHAYGMLGDIHRETGNADEAVLMYTYAAQYAESAPNGGHSYLRKIEEITNKENGEPSKADGTYPVQAVYSAGVNPTLWGLCLSLIALVFLISSFFIVRGNPGPLVFHLPRNFLIAAASDGLLGGLILTWMRLIRHSDAELFALTISSPGRSGMGLLGFYLLFSGLIFYYVAMVVYAAVAYFEEAFSRSVVTIFCVTSLLLAILTWLCPTGKTYFLLSGGNLIFSSMLIGWILGSVGRNPW